MRGIEVRLWRERGGALALALTYALKGDLSCLRIPPPGPPRRAERLWLHTCFEAFISVKGDPAYREFNFAPSGEWAAYLFRRYREAAPILGEVSTPGIAVRRTESSVEIEALVRVDYLPAIQPRAARARAFRGHRRGERHDLLLGAQAPTWQPRLSPPRRLHVRDRP